MNLVITSTSKTTQFGSEVRQREPKKIFVSSQLSSRDCLCCGWIIFQHHGQRCSLSLSLSGTNSLWRDTKLSRSSSHDLAVKLLSLS